MLINYFLVIYMTNTLSDLETQNEIISLHFGKTPDELLDEEVLSWVERFSNRFREIWESWEKEIFSIAKKLYN